MKRGLVGLAEQDGEPVPLFAVRGAERPGRILNRMELVTAVDAVDVHDAFNAFARSVRTISVSPEIVLASSG